MRIDAETLAGKLPGNFTLGVATAAFQIEGAVSADGRGPSGWDAFTHMPGRIVDGSDADVACDHYYRMDEDVQLIQGLGVDSYRFSLSWPRIQPAGKGPVNRKGLDFYDRLLDRLLERGISPMCTIYHWDTPLPLERQGGWLNRETAYRLGDFAAIAADAFGDRVHRWVTINEPATVTLNGYALGLHAPGVPQLLDCLPAAHHLLLGHGLSVQALRAATVPGEVGIANVYSPVVAATDGLANELMVQFYDIVFNAMFSDPVLLGSYPRAHPLLSPFLAYFRTVPAEDLALMHLPLDFYGLNYYFPSRIAPGPGPLTGPQARPEGVPEAFLQDGQQLPFHLAGWPGYDRTGFGWPIAPDYLAEALTQLARRYPDLPPVHITEGGASFPDVVVEDVPTGGPVVADVQRVAYLGAHLDAALDATAPGGPAAGIDLRGYYVWTLLDNFEWAAGYSQRFGLVYVDFDTQQRIPKTSYRWLQSLAADRPSRSTAPR
ncbi:family 1 glycosylhydrolase [Arthrobacter sp. I2-34]|uniref:Family 1 glycosylhydrolase n=1 Tax=Arthrobacter hankyongi TaxID=2904801 RepID=A0ABS9L4M1_9MICC|nr:family 1 glycosylhydrolase [Arthrobacter hankyongi]MCG2621575.1 family 1 glycosylhydrolase [Arthrobacter hankyongi]